MRGHGLHVVMCAAMIAGVPALALLSGRAVTLGPIIGCVLMMGVMMWLMGRTSGRE